MTIQIYTLSPDYLKFPLPTFDYMGSCVLAGGAIRDSIQNIQFSDLDIFGPNKEALDEFANRNLLLKDYRLIYTSKFADTYVKEGSPVVQCVFGRPMIQTEDDGKYSIYTGVTKLFKEFPFTINLFAYDGKQIYTTPEALADTLLKLMRVNNLDKPDIFDTLERIDRYRRKGYQEIPGVTENVMAVIDSLTNAEFDAYSHRPSGKNHCTGGIY